MSNLQKEIPKNWLKNEKVQILEFGTWWPVLVEFISETYYFRY